LLIYVLMLSHIIAVLDEVSNAIHRGGAAVNKLLCSFFSVKA